MAKGIENIAYNNGLLKGYFKRVGKRVLEIFQDFCPYDKGNLLKAIKLEYHIDDMGFDIIIDKDYMVYTNEIWISPIWGRPTTTKGKAHKAGPPTNPNRKWFNLAFETASDYIYKKINGKFDENYNPVMTKVSDVVSDYIMEKYKI